MDKGQGEIVQHAGREARGRGKAEATKACVVCGKSFVVNTPNKEACSRACSNVMTMARFVEKNGPFMCKHCGNEFTPKVQDRTTFCSRGCAYEFRNVHAKGKSSAIYFNTCVECGKLFSNHKAKYCCSKECEKTKARKYSRNSSMFKSSKGEKECRECGKKFTPHYGIKLRDFCSNVCSKKNTRRTAKASRRAIKKKAVVENISLRRVYLRDGGKCMLCGRKLKWGTKVPNIHAPTIDHIKPLSKGGSHEYKNVQLACFKCNTMKGTGCVEGREQLRLC